MKEGEIELAQRTTTKRKGVGDEEGELPGLKIAVGSGARFYTSYRETIDCDSSRSPGGTLTLACL